MRIEEGDLLLTDDLDPRYARDLAFLANDPYIAQNIGGHSFPSPYSVESALNFIGLNRSDGRPFRIDFLVFAKGKVCGVIGLSEIDYEDAKAHVGYWIGKEYRGNGYATRALALVCDMAVKKLRLHRLYTKVFDFNVASLIVLLKNHFRIEGLERDTFHSNSGYHSMYTLGRILEEEHED